MTVAMIVVVALSASARNELLRGHVSINERRSDSAAKPAASKNTSDLAAKYGSAASSPAVAGAIKKAESAPDARAVADAQEALAHGVCKPGADPMLAIMYGYVPPGMSQEQASMLYKTLPHLPRMPESITAEKADRYAGVPDPEAGLPQGLSREDIQAANGQMLDTYIRERFGPVSVPPLHRDHDWLAQSTRKGLSNAVVQTDHQISLIRPQYGFGESGSIREMTNSSGNIVYQQSFDPYGNATQLQGSGPQPDFDYQGYYVHQRSGLNLTRTRAYSPVLGRFLNRDSIQEKGGTNLFAYCQNDPIDYADPSGLYQWKSQCCDATTPCPKPGVYAHILPPANCAQGADGKPYFISNFEGKFHKYVFQDGDHPEGGYYDRQPVGPKTWCPDPGDK